MARVSSSTICKLAPPAKIGQISQIEASKPAPAS